MPLKIMVGVLKTLHFFHTTKVEIVQYIGQFPCFLEDFFHLQNFIFILFLVFCYIFTFNYFLTLLRKM